MAVVPSDNGGKYEKCKVIGDLVWPNARRGARGTFALKDPEERLEIGQYTDIEENPTGELSDRGRRAVKVVEELTGSACESAYRLCPGRYTSGMVFQAIFDEINLKTHEHDHYLEDI
ncbi:hypothetical protein E2C01_055855 [Portunus trituberculatus]|uniref:Uncharacterized protein n=1 Tax=Portunus trituberculatus TaxID=210409 RepID=A0A5B7GW59_PORTR|nr:hypothetical protein [Portunus trituberculatus]